MDPTIVVALIAAVGGVLAALVQKGRKENKSDHNVVANLLVNVKDDIIHLHQKVDHLDDQIDKVDDKIDVHLKSHRRKINTSIKNKETEMFKKSAKAVKPSKGDGILTAPDPAASAGQAKISQRPIKNSKGKTIEKKGSSAPKPAASTGQMKIAKRPIKNTKGKVIG